MVKRRDERSQVPGPRLTERELEVLKLVAKGMNNRDIGARALHLGEHGQEPCAKHPGEASPALEDGSRRLRRPGETPRHQVAPGPAGFLSN